MAIWLDSCWLIHTVTFKRKYLEDIDESVGIYGWCYVGIDDNLMNRGRIEMTADADFVWAIF